MVFLLKVDLATNFRKIFIQLQEFKEQLYQLFSIYTNPFEIHNSILLRNIIQGFLN